MTSGDAFIHIKPEPGSPVQLADLRPVAWDSLVRIGNQNDGGYVVPLEAVKASSALLSFGLAHDWTFERDFKRRKPDAPVHCYDHTVSLATAFQYSVGQLPRWIVLRRPGAFRRAFTWIDYRKFFGTDAHHFRQRLWHNRDDNSATVDDAFIRLPAGCQAFVKMDIEGGEYQVLDDLLAHSGNITALAMEFHDLEIDPERFNAAIRSIKQHFHIVHIHGNNMGGVTPFHFPAAPEITFLNKRFFSSQPSPSQLTYPAAGLDHPNNTKLPEFVFEF